MFPIKCTTQVKVLWSNLTEENSFNKISKVEIFIMQQNHILYKLILALCVVEDAMLRMLIIENSKITF